MQCCEKDKIKGGKEQAAETNQEVFLGQEKFSLVLGALGVLLIGLLVFNQFMINDLNKKISSLQVGGVAVATGSLNSGPVNSGPQASLAQTQTAQLWDAIRPKGKPDVYGDELGVSYDSVEAAIPRLYETDDYYGSKKIELSAEKQQRYIAITTAISCEYCCGANAITTAAGAPACGCAHSAAMRGLAKYLLDKHPEMADNQILSELGKWKVLFFPSDSVKKAAALQANGIQLDYISLSSNQYRGIEKQAAVAQSTGQGGGALPSQVGGC